MEKFIENRIYTDPCLLIINKPRVKANQSWLEFVIDAVLRIKMHLLLLIVQMN